MPTTNQYLPSEDEFARLEGELFTRIERSHKRQVVRHRLAAASVAVFIAGASIAAGTVANPGQATWTANCYGAPNTSSQPSVALLSNRASDGPDESARPPASKVARAVKQCGLLWEGGMFGASSSPTPHLQPCLQDNLVIAVFPRKHVNGSAESFCENLGMSAP